VSGDCALFATVHRILLMKLSLKMEFSPAEQFVSLFYGKIAELYVRECKIYAIQKSIYSITIGDIKCSNCFYF